MIGNEILDRDTLYIIRISGGTLIGKIWNIGKDFIEIDECFLFIEQVNKQGSVQFRLAPITASNERELHVKLLWPGEMLVQKVHNTSPVNELHRNLVAKLRSGITVAKTIPSAQAMGKVGKLN